jgi:hypothetical protein
LGDIREGEFACVGSREYNFPGGDVSMGKGTGGVRNDGPRQARTANVPLAEVRNQGIHISLVGLKGHDVVPCVAPHTGFNFSDEASLCKVVRYCRPCGAYVLNPAFPTAQNISNQTMSFCVTT